MGKRMMRRWAAGWKRASFTTVPKDDTELFRQFMDNESFRRWLTDTIFGLTYETSGVT